MNTERIDHSAEARKITDQTLSYGNYGEDAGAVVSMIAAQVHATLALVEQQHIANLIALGQYRAVSDDFPAKRLLVQTPVFRPDDDVAQVIREGLEL